MPSFRESKGGDFFLEQGRRSTQRLGVVPALRFTDARGGAAVDLWGTERTDPRELLAGAGLDWRVDSCEVLLPFGDGLSAPIRGYRALVRSDNGRAMSVVTTAYRVAENHLVAEAARDLARAHAPRACLVGAVGFGHHRERTLYVVRVSTTADAALLLLAYNSHGGEGAVRFQLVEVERWTGTVMTPAVPHSSLTVAHVGDVKDRLRRLQRRELVKDYTTETEQLWQQLEETFWTPRHTKGLLDELWPQPSGRTQVTSESTTLHHPHEHLTDAFRDCTDAADAFRRLCRYMDHESEARERGDFTKDRDERLALGAGLRHKQRAWTWIVDHT